MRFNPSPRARVVLYAFTALGTVFVQYLSLKHFIGDAEETLWAGIVTVVTAMAGLNVMVNKGNK